MCRLPVKVLLIDGKGGYLWQLENQLQAAGCRTFLAGQDDQCIDVLAQARLGQFDLALVSMHMGGLDQTDLLEVLREVNSAQYLPIVCLEPDLDHSRNSAILKLGADLVLDRNVPLQTLLAYMQVLAAGKRREDRLLEQLDQTRKTLTYHKDQLRNLRQNNATLRKLSITDPLTRMFNNRYLQQWLPQAFAAAKRHDRPLTLILLDVDYFKWINDQCGHLAGDYALKRLAVLLRRTVRDADVVVRYGGDEFLLALPETTSGQATELAERILKQLHNSRLLPPRTSQPARITCSMGCATFPSDLKADSYEQLLALADQALYAAKRAGRDCLRTWQQLSPQLRSSPVSQPIVTA